MQCEIFTLYAQLYCCNLAPEFQLLLINLYLKLSGVSVVYSGYLLIAAQGGSQSSADRYALEALSHWRVLIGQPGCWDPFVLRHAEVISG